MTESKIILSGRYYHGGKFTGPSKVAFRLFNEMRKIFPNVEFIEYYFEGNTYSYWKKLFGKEKIILSDGGIVWRLGIFRIISFVLLNEIELVHLVTFERFAIIFYMMKFIKKYKIIFTVHGIIKHEWTFRSGKKNKFFYQKDIICEYIYMNMTDKLCFYSGQEVLIAADYYKISKSRITLVANGVDEIFTEAYSKRIENNSNLLNVVVMGELTRPEKGLKQLLEIISCFSLNMHLYIISDSLSAFTGVIPKNIKVDGLKTMMTEELAVFYRDKNLFISGSLCDSFPLAVIEAMAAGLIPIVSKETGMNRYILHGKNGFIYEVTNGNELESIIRLLNDNNLVRKKISESAKDISKILNWADITRNYLTIYKETVA